MTIEQDFLPYAVGGSANVLSQAAYAALTTLLQNGLTSGIVPSNELNKIMRQPSIIASVIGQFIVANSGQPAIDDGTTATLLANFTNAVNAASKTKVVLTDTGTANAYTAANPVPLTVLPTATGFTQTVKIAHLNTGTSTYAPDGLATAPIYSLAGALLQGNELPVNGVATLVSFVDPLLNSGNLCWVLYECVGGAQPVAPASASEHAVQWSQVVGVVGTSRNAVMSIAAAGTSATWSASELILETSNGLNYCLRGGPSAAVNLATTGAGGMDTGTAPASSFVGIYGIWNPTTSTFSLLAQSAAGVTLSEVYNGSHMPAGYTASALIGILLTNSSGQFIVCQLVGRRVSYQSRAEISTAATTSGYTAFTGGADIPKNSKRVFGYFGASQSTNGTINLFVASDANGCGAQETSIGTAASGNTNSTAGNFAVDVISPQTVYYNVSYSGSGTFTATVNFTGFEF